MFTPLLIGSDKHDVFLFFFDGGFSLWSKGMPYRVYDVTGVPFCFNDLCSLDCNLLQRVHTTLFSRASWMGTRFLFSFLGRCVILKWSRVTGKNSFIYCCKKTYGLVEPYVFLLCFIRWFDMVNRM